jgi:Lon-like ATP-dependent protease
VRGEVLPVGGITAKVQAAIQAGFSEVIVPKSNLEDIVLPKTERAKIKVISVSRLNEVLDHALVKNKKTLKLLSSLKKILSLSLPVSFFETTKNSTKVQL